MTDSAGPVAIPTPQPEAATTEEVDTTNAGVGVPAPNHTAEAVPQFTGFDKLAAEQRSEPGVPPFRARFNADNWLHIHPEMPAAFGLFLKGAGETDPLAIYDALRSVVVSDEHPLLESILKLPPDGGGVTLSYLGQWLEQLGLYYSGVPLDER